MAWIEGTQKKRPKDLPEKEWERQYALEGYLEEDIAKRELFKFFKNNIAVAANILMGVDLFPYQSIIVKANMDSDYVLDILGRGSGKTWLAGVFAGLYALFNPGAKIGILSASFRQAKRVFQYIEEIAAKDKASLFESCISKVEHKNDEWSIRIGESVIYALPLGCLRDNSLVSYENGPRRISSDFNNVADGQWINREEKVWSDGRFRTSARKFHNGVAKTKKITTEKGFGIEGTLGHKIKVLDSDCVIKWKEFSEISKGDFVLIDRSEKDFVNTSGVTNEEAYFIGAMVGDGCWTNEYQLEFINTDQELIDNVMSKTSYDWKTYDGQRYYALGKDIASKFREHFNGEFLYSYQKYVPVSVLNGGKEAHRQFLMALFDTDGHCQVSTKKGGVSVSVGFTTTSERLATEVQQLLLGFGIISDKHSRQRKNLERYKSKLKRSYGISVTGKNAELFAEKIGFGISRKNDKLLAGISRKQRNNSCLDGIPYVKDRIYEILKDKRVKRGTRAAQDHTNPRNIRGKKIITFDYATKIIEKYESLDGFFKELRVLNDQRYFYDKVLSIEDSECDTFDLYVEENNTYCVNGFVSHNSGEKLRGFRFNCIIIDELLLMPNRVINEVIIPFLGVVQNPDERSKMREAEEYLMKEGLMTEDERYIWPNNKLIGLSSASYAFEYLYELYKVYENLIVGNTNSNVAKDLLENFGKNADATRAIIHMSYEAIPEDIYDKNLLEQAIQTMSESQFAREFRSVFTDDSSGFFRISKMRECTVEDGGDPSVELKGDPESEYIISLDPSWAENDSSDDFAMQVLKINPENQSVTLVHSYAVAGAKLRSHIKYFLYLLQNFNVAMIWMDYAGGVQFVNSCNESELFKDAGIKLGVMVEEFEPNENYKENVAKGKKEYNKTNRNFVVFRKFSTDWIRKGNELLQASFDHKKIWFGAKCFNSTYVKQTSQNIPINDIDFLNDENYKETGGAKMIDLLERQQELMDLTKAECALIQVRTSPQGTQVFDLPENIKRGTGPNRTRRDSYTALVIGNWGAKVYFDMLNSKQEPVYEGFTPTFIK